MKLLRTVRLDRSDTFVYAAAAAPGEWATVGSFMFWDDDPAALDGKARAAFRSGFLGLASFGWSTLVEVAEAPPADVEAAALSLAHRLLAHHGAPDKEAALAAARDEIEFAASLAGHPLGTVIAMQRTIETDGSIRERFRTIKTTLQPGSNTFAQGCVEPIGISREGPDDLGIEEVDFIGLMKDRT